MHIEEDKKIITQAAPEKKSIKGYEYIFTNKKVIIL